MENQVSKTCHFSCPYHLLLLSTRPWTVDTTHSINSFLGTVLVRTRYHEDDDRTDNSNAADSNDISKLINTFY